MLAAGRVANTYPHMKKTFSSLGQTLLFAFALLMPSALVSCEDNTGTTDDTEFSDNWQQRNATFFADTLAKAKAAVEQAKATYGDDWQQHCDWRVMRSYAKVAGGPSTDSVCARVVERGTGSGYPLYGDSVKVNYIGRLMPTASYAEGRVFDYSGIYATEEAVFGADFATPAALAVSNSVEGFGTALMNMRIGDRWVLYVPQELAYLSASTDDIPAYSTLVFDLQLKAFYRKGEAASK